MYILFAAIFILLLYYLQSYVYRTRWSDKLKTDAFFSVNEVFEGEGAELTETIENAKWLPLPMVKIKLELSRQLRFRDTENSVVSDYFYRTDIYSIGPNQKVTRSMKFRCTARGYYTFRGVDVIGTGLFFSNEYVESVDTSSFLYVFPKLHNPGIMEPVLNRINGETLTKRNLAEDPFEFRGIREYQPYDTMKNINWKASAKTGDLLVNVHDYTSHRTIRVFIDLDRPKMITKDEVIELCISMAAANIAEYAQNGIPVSVYSNGCDIITGTPLFIDEGCGEYFLRGTNRSLARIDLSKKNADFRKTFENQLFDDTTDSYTVIYSANMQQEFQNVLMELKDRNKDFCWVFPKYKDEDFEIAEELKENCLLVTAEEALYELSLS